VRKYSHIFDAAQVKNYCIGFLHKEDVGNREEVPEDIGKISQYAAGKKGEKSDWDEIAGD